MIHPPQVRPEEPIAVTPHDGICGGESQQWLSYPTNLHVRVCEGRGWQHPRLLGIAPDVPTEIASFLTETFGSHVLDAANLAADSYVLVSEDLYFRQLANAAVTVRGVWLQPIFAFARDQGLLGRERYADLITKLAWRRQ